MAQNNGKKVVKSIPNTYYLSSFIDLNVTGRIPIREQRCEVILMLTELIERGIHKCTHYWPDEDVSENAIFGELEVTVCDKDYKSCYILSRFKIKLRKDTEARN